MTERYWTIAEASVAIAAHRLSPVELVKDCLQRIDALDSTLHSFVLVLGDRAMDQARDAERAIMSGQEHGPLCGIPIGLKDIYETAGISTTGQSRIRLEHIPANDSTCARKLAEAGAILLGKLTTYEFAMGGPSFDLPFPPARNPWNTACATGGSSSGSAVAVAAGLALGALGTDTGGSIRFPSANCGIAGLKPSYGLVSRAGIFPLAFSLDHAGPMAWTSRDCAMLLQAIAGHDSRDPASVNHPIPDFAAGMTGDLRGIRIGVLWHTLQELRIDPEVEIAMHEAIAVLQGLGSKVIEATIPPLADYHAAAVIIMLTEAYAIHEKDLLERWKDYGASFRHRVMPGALLSGCDYVQATRWRGRLSVQLEECFSHCDALLLPTTTAPAGPIDNVSPTAFLEGPSFATPASVAGLPALNVCCGFSKGGMPIGVQLIGRRFDEATLLKIGDSYERATLWRKRRPQQSTFKNQVAKQ